MPRMVCYGCWDTALSRVRASKSPRALPSRCRYGHGNQGSVPAECVQPVGGDPQSVQSLHHHRPRGAGADPHHADRLLGQEVVGPMDQVQPKGRYEAVCNGTSAVYGEPVEDSSAVFTVLACHPAGTRHRCHCVSGNSSTTVPVGVLPVSSATTGTGHSCVCSGLV